jgi:single-strand DNA-binding protein
MNTVNLIGNLTRDMELKYTSSGTAIGSFSIAVNARVKKGDEWVDRADFFNLTMFGKRAESLSRYMTKGTRVGVTGKLQLDRWEDKDGNARQRIKIIVDNIDLLGGGQKQSVNQGPRNDDVNDGDFQDDVVF